MIGERYHPSAEADAARAFCGSGDEDLGCGDDLSARGVVLADPSLVVAQLVETADHLEVTLEGENGILPRGVKGREEHAEPGASPWPPFVTPVTS